MYIISRAFKACVLFSVAGFFSIAFASIAYAQSANLISNGSLETASGSAPQGWVGTYWGSPAPVFSYPTTGNNASKGASITLSANSTGDANWRPASAISVTPGAKYTFTTWYKSTAATEIDAEFTSSSGAVSYVWLADVPSSGGTWKQLAVTFTVPSGISKAIVYQLLDKKGTLTIDDVTLVNISSAPSTPTVSISSAPSSIISGQSSSLTWSSSNATSCTASGAWSGSKALSGTLQITPSTTSTYTIICSGTGGTVSQSTTVTVTTAQPPTPTLSFTSTASTLLSGQSATLSWGATNATSCTASNGWSGTKTLSGSQIVAPTAQTTYALTCVGGGGSVTKSITINVTAPPTGNTFTEGMVTLSFDDAWASQYTNALPILKTAGIPSTFYLISSVIQGGWQDYMTTAMAQAIANDGHEIGDHTISHPDLTTISSAQITNEITASRTYLQNLTGKTITSIAYPYGAVNANVKTLTQQAGYVSGRGVDFDQQNTPKSDKFNLFSQCLENTDTLASIKAQIDKAKTNKTWYILCFHEIKGDGAQYSTSPAFLQQVIAYIKQVGIKTVTVSQGRALMGN